MKRSLCAVVCAVVGAVVVAAGGAGCPGPAGVGDAGPAAHEDAGTQADAGVADAGPACTPGDEGCACNDAGGCNGTAAGGAGLRCDIDTSKCVAIVDDSDVPGVPSTACYTPCSQSLTLPDGTFRYCSPEGLMAGCLGALSCVDGSCVGAGGLPPSCEVPTDCPAHQTCIEGGCYSNCAVDADCSDGAVCDSLVCRIPCTTDPGGGCPSGYSCVTSDTAQGVCKPAALPTGTPTQPAAESYALSTTSFAFSTFVTAGRFSITNHSGRALTFSIAKTEQTTFTDGARQISTNNPLFWITVTDSVDVPAGGSVDVDITGAHNDVLDRWEGRLLVHNDDLGDQEIWLEYAATPDGAWTGTYHSFINFDDKDIGAWKAATGANARRVAAAATQNAFLAKWTEFRTSTLFTLAQWEQVLKTTVDGSWKNADIQGVCDAEFSSDENAACYLFADGTAGDPGIRVYTQDNTSLRIPTGVLDMPFAIRIQKVDATHYAGRIESDETLQDPGDPPVSLTFGIDPAGCETAGAAACLAPVVAFNANVVTGGRFLDDDGLPCAASGFVQHDVPWLVPAFTQGTTVGSDGASLVRRECREGAFPVDPATSSIATDKNASFAGANPIPDGQPRARQLTLLDGVLVNEDRLLLLVQETFTANIGAPNADFSAYGVIDMKRSPQDLSDDDFTPGAPAPTGSLSNPGLLHVGCSADLVDTVLGHTSVNDTSDADTLAHTLIAGFNIVPPASSALDPAQVHWLCNSTGRFDGGLTRWAEDGKETCPVDSGVTFFTYDGDLADHPCQGAEADRCPEGDCTLGGKPGTCAETLKVLSTGGGSGGTALLDPPWLCDNEAPFGVPEGDSLNCLDDRQNMTSGKIFYDRAAPGGPTFAPLGTAIDDAFRYKSRFRSRNSSLGFVPAVCDLSSDVLPYCFDPAAIDAIEDRIDCLVELNDGALLSSGERTEVNGELVQTFSVLQGASADGTVIDGFERLNAELLIMLADDAFTSALSARFDLAGSSIAVFPGDQLEPNGIRLSGGAGFEMLLLYRAVQTYDLVLDRFNRLSPYLWRGLTDESKNFVTLDSIATYFNRLILASTKKATAASEIAERYSSFNRPDLARHVIEREYSEAYLESINISQLMRSSVAVLEANEVDQLRIELDSAQRQYRVALEQMREDYQKITDDVTFFGDAPDFVPFPQAGQFDISAPQTLIDRALQTAADAAGKEDAALSNTRAFDTDAAEFQSELNTTSTQFENQLAQLCGTFESSGQFVPAIPKYAPLSPITGIEGDPCGLTGNGDIHDQVGALEQANIELKIAVQGVRAVIGQVNIEQQRVLDECNARVDIAQIQFDAAGDVVTLQKEVADKQNEIAQWDRTIALIDRSISALSATGAAANQITLGIRACAPPFLEVGAGTPAECISGATAAAADVAAASLQASALGTQTAANFDIAKKQSQIADDEQAVGNIQRTAEYNAAVAQCCLDDNPVVGSCAKPGPLMIDSNATVDNLMTGIIGAELTALRAELDVRLAQGKLQLLQSQARRLESQQEDAEQLLINAAAARNDPNVRILKNADVLEADRTFQNTLVDAFRATRVFEYYTAQSYAHKDELFLARLVGRGEHNVDAYLNQLQRDLNQFEQDFGRPDPRVAIVSLRDDVFKIPSIDVDGKALTQDQRLALFRAKLADPALLDDNARITVPFATTLDAETSPITAIHKLTAVEAEIIGTDVGDRLGRVYLTARGTGTVRALDGSLVFHRLPPITAVVNPFFNGARVFDENIYHNTRLNDRPLVNTEWQLVLNQRDEPVNNDINLQSLADIRVYFFFEDFTQVPP